MVSFYLILFVNFIIFNVIIFNIYITQSKEIGSYPWVLGIDSLGQID